MVGCQFVNVADGVSGIPLKDLKGEFTDFDLIEIASCDNSGRISISSYTYFTLEGSGFEDGWYTDEGPAEDVSIPHGSAVWFTGSDGAKPVTISGQVFNGNEGIFTHTINMPTEMVCSAFPVAFNPNDTSRVTWQGLTDFDLIEVGTCDEMGRVSISSYTYFTLEGSGFEDGWYTDEGPVDFNIVEAGKGFWLTVGNPGEAKMIETSPLK